MRVVKDSRNNRTGCDDVDHGKDKDGKIKARPSLLNPRLSQQSNSYIMVAIGSLHCREVSRIRNSQDGRKKEQASWAKKGKAVAASND